MEEGTGGFSVTKKCDGRDRFPEVFKRRRELFS
jgi:hypothetical protein